MKKLLLSGAIFTAISGALPSVAHDGNDGWVTAEGYYLWSNTYAKPQIRIPVTDGYYNPAGSCDNLDSYMVSTLLPIEAQQRIYSTLLSASLAGRPVQLYIDSNSCELGRPQVNTVVLKPT